MPALNLNPVANTKTAAQIIAEKNQKADQKPTEWWLNVGDYLRDDDGEVLHDPETNEPIFLNMFGLSLDNVKPLQESSNNLDYSQKNQAINALRKEFMDTLQENFEYGQEEEVTLIVRVRRAQPKQEAQAGQNPYLQRASGMSFLRKK